MAGRGPRPKDPEKRIRRGADPQAQTILRFEPAPQPALPSLPGGFAWCAATLAWWDLWGSSPQSEHFAATDWDFLRDTAMLHQQLWEFGDMSVLNELRIRVAKFGATMEDRARLRMQFASADEADASRPGEPFTARQRYGQKTASVTHLKSVPAVAPAKKAPAKKAPAKKAPAKKAPAVRSVTKRA